MEMRKSLLRALCALALTIASLPQSVVTAEANCNTPALFIFGDSLVDTGNNDKLLTIAKANHVPYGRDFMGKRPTGRFSNGQIAVDYLASFIGLPFPPPYLLAGDNILGGVNFASAGSGILNSTGSVFGQHIPLLQQVGYFTNLKQKLISKLGYTKTSVLISKSLYFIAVGSNDYILNYFSFPVGQSPLQLQYSPDAFVKLLTTKLEQRLMDLYKLGARKFAVASLPALGCLPSELFLFRSSHGECISFINDQITSYNVALLSLLKQLEMALPDVHFAYLNVYHILDEIVKDPSSYGIVHINRACCGLGPYGGATPCTKDLTPVCTNASEYIFWDLFHPTSAVNLIAMTQFWQGSSPDVYPLNLRDLTAL